MRSSTSHFDQRVPLSKICAILLAWYAVHYRISKEDFLEWRKRVYEALYRRSHYPLPFDIVIEQGEVKKIANSASEPFWEQARDDLTGEAMGVPIETQLESAEHALNLEELEKEIARNNDRRQVASEQVEALEEEEVEAIRSGAVLGLTTNRGSSGGRRRPRLPFPWILVLGYIALVLMIQFEGYQLALPFLDWIGVDTTRLGKEWLRNPIGIVSGAGFALSASVGLFLLWYLLLRRAALISETWQSADPGMTALRVGGILALCCILFVGTYVLANMRHGLADDISRLGDIQQGQHSGADMGKSVFLFLTLLVPFAAAYIHHQLGQSAYWGHRHDITLKQEQWDREEEERLLADKRLADRMGLRQRNRERIERQRTQLQNQRRALAQRAQAAQRQQLAQLKQARHSTEVYARSLLAALVQHRYYYIRASNRCQADHLVPEQARRDAKAQPAQPKIQTLLPAGRNGQEL